MSFGWIVSKANVLSNRLLRLYVLFFGIPDFHSHIRWRVIKNFLTTASTTVDVGAGMGLMSFEYVRLFRKRIDVLCYTDNELKSAISICYSNKWLLPFVRIKKDDAEELATCQDEFYDQAMLIDVLEHLSTETKAIKHIRRILRPGGIVVVSVPTPLYPHYFGRGFDKAIGHKRHYTILHLKESFERHGFKLVRFSPYTFRFTSILCYIYYVKSQCSFLRLILLPVLTVISLLTERFGQNAYSSLVAVFSKM